MNDRNPPPPERDPNTTTVCAPRPRPGRSHPSGQRNANASAPLPRRAASTHARRHAAHARTKRSIELGSARAPTAANLDRWLAGKPGRKRASRAGDGDDVRAADRRRASAREEAPAGRRAGGRRRGHAHARPSMDHDLPRAWATATPRRPHYCSGHAFPVDHARIIRTEPAKAFWCCAGSMQASMQPGPGGCRSPCLLALSRPPAFPFRPVPPRRRLRPA
jgi:hypothetical protein